MAEEETLLLVDCRGVQALFGVKRATAERIMRHCEVKVHGLGRRVFVYREDALRVVREHEIRDAA